MRILLTGAAGFIPSHVAELLVNEGYEVVGIDNFLTGDWRNISHLKMDFVAGSITDYDLDSLGKFDAVIHMAARPLQASLKFPLSYDRDLVGGTVRVIEFARKQGIPVVFSSTSAIYGTTEHLPTKESDPVNPISPYALQKLVGEQYLDLYWRIWGLKSVALRYFNAYGERQPSKPAYSLVFSDFFRELKENKPFSIYGSGENRRDYVYVKDVAKANLKALEYVLSDRYNGFEVFNIGSGKNYSVNEVADLVSKEHPKIHTAEQIEAKETLADITKAKEILGWEPETTVEQWLQK